MGSPRIAELLESISQGDASASDELFPLVYDELHQLASAYMRRERDGHTLQATALIHEAFLKLVKSPKKDDSYENIDHFIATAAVVMRRILVNHAKAKKADKRGGGVAPLQLDEVTSAFQKSSVDLIALDDALNELEKIDSEQRRLVELRFFGGMSFQQCAKIMNISERKAYYEWSHARAWLRTQIETE